MAEPSPRSVEAARLAAVLRSSSDAITLQTLEGVITTWNQGAERLYGYSEAEAVGMSIHRLVPPERQSELEALLERARRGEELAGFRTRRVRRDGQRIDVWLSATLLRDTGGRPAGLATSERDITEWLRVRRQLLRSNRELDRRVHERTAALLRANRKLAAEVARRKRDQAQLAWEREKAVVTLSSIGEGVITCDSRGEVEYLNPVAETLTQWSLAEAVGRPLADVLHIVDERTRERMDPRRYWAPQGSHFSSEDHHVVIGRDGASLPVQETATPILGSNGRPLGAVIILRDVSASRQLARRLSYEASHDPLTGLINRAEFHRRLQTAIDEARREGHQHVLCYLDLDNFKPVNDRAGHAAGDELLRQLARQLKDGLRAEDVLGRLGGDEFGVLLHHCDRAAAVRLAEGLRAKVEDFRFAWKGQLFQVTVSIGLTPINADSGDFDSVRAAADAACYQAKELGRNRIAVQAVQGPLPRQEDWRGRLEQALVMDGFSLLCQPIVPLSRRSRGRWAEVLLRLRGGGGELLPPGSFLAAAERYNLLPSLDRWVIERVFEHGSADCSVLSVNLSVQVLEQEDFIDFIDEQVDQHRVDPRRFCFELSEASVLSNYTRAQRLLWRLKRRGFQLSMDRFGNGYASLGYLRQLPMDSLKIDGESVKNIYRDRLHLTFVRSLNEIAHTLGRTTVACSVQDRQILATLRRVGVDWGQGYALSRPLPLERFIARG